MPLVRRITRKELRQPDEFISFARRTLAFLRVYERVALVSGVFAGGVLLLILGWQWYLALVSAWASQGLQQALSTYRASAYQRAAEQFSEVASRWPETASGRLASLYLGHCYVKQESYTKAIEVYKGFLETTPEGEYLYQLALVSLAVASEHEGSDAEAHSFYSQAAFLGGPFTGEALLGKARLYEKLSDSAKAIEVYRDFLNRYPESPMEPMLKAKVATAAVSAN